MCVVVCVIACRRRRCAAAVVVGVCVSDGRSESVWGQIV